MWVFPIAAAAVSAAFSAILGAQWRSRRRPHLAAWSVALLTFAVASAAAGVGMLSGWNAALFRTYYLFGAIVNVPVLALGTIYLLAPRGAANACALVVAAAVGLATLVVATTDVETSALDTAGIPRGSETLATGVRLLSRYYSIIGFVIVVTGAVWSAFRLLRTRQPHLKRLATANLLIALGTTVVAVASEVVRVGTGSVQGSIFAVGLFVGVSLMFAGFLRTRPPASAREAAT